MSYPDDENPYQLNALALPLQDTDVFVVQRSTDDVSKIAASDLNLKQQLFGTAGETISAHKALVLVDGELLQADPTDDTQIGLYVGISITAGNIGEQITYVQAGELTGGSFTAGERYYVGNSGALSTTPLATSAAWQKFLGVAKSATVLVITTGPSYKTA